MIQTASFDFTMNHWWKAVAEASLDSEMPDSVNV